MIRTVHICSRTVLVSPTNSGRVLTGRGESCHQQKHINENEANEHVLPQAPEIRVFLSSRLLGFHTTNVWSNFLGYVIRKAQSCNRQPKVLPRCVPCAVCLAWMCRVQFDVFLLERKNMPPVQIAWFGCNVEFEDASSSPNKRSFVFFFFRVFFHICFLKVDALCSSIVWGMYLCMPLQLHGSPHFLPFLCWEGFEVY